MQRTTSSRLDLKPASDTTLQEILVSLSFALDLTEGAVPGHAIRSCLLAVRIAREAGLDLHGTSNLYYASLLKDVGCSSNSARMCAIVGGDDRMVKAGTKLADWTRPLQPEWPTMKMLWREVLPGASTVAKGIRIARMALTQHTNNRQVIEIRCDRGAAIVRKLGFAPEVAAGVRHLDEHWDGAGYPQGLRGNAIPVISRLMAVAQHLDVFCMERGPEEALDTLQERSKRWFDPALVRAARSLDKRRQLFADCLPHDPVERTRDQILQFDIEGQTRLSGPDIDNICETFSWVVDAKSPFTFRHSIGVMDAAVAIGNALGLREDRMELLRRSALLHDIGKLGISNTILDKPSKLTPEEFQAVTAHPGLSAGILGRISAFGEVAVLAGEHHERLDGTGYPNRLHGEDLALESRLLAVADIYGALSEDRPYRAGLAPAQIQAIMDRDIPAKLDPVCYEALRSMMDDLAQANRTSPSKPQVNWSIADCDMTEAFI
jgi:HD-GYP domain-containing protein (c-di-GMP phosphodiesterase class II)